MLPHQFATGRSFIVMSSLLATLLPFPAASSIEQPYPDTRRTGTVDHYHGTDVADPYRWLEDDNAPETTAWVEAQNKITFSFLDRIPKRRAIGERLKALWNYERFGAPRVEGGRYFYSHNTGLQNQSVLLVAESLDAEPRVLLDPNTLSPDGTVSLSNWSVSDDGKLFAYSLSRSGADWLEWRVRDVDTGKDLSDLLNWSKFSGASWSKDGSGFYYSRYDEPKPGEERKGVVEYQKLYFHKVGTPQGDDRLIYERRDHKDWGFHGGVTDDGHWLIIIVTRGTDPKNCVFYRDLTKPNAPIVELLPGFEADFSFIDNDGSVFFFQTDLNAPLRRVIAIDVNQPSRENWKELIPETKDTLEVTNLVGGRFICNYLRDAHSAVKFYALEPVDPAQSGHRARFQKELELPGLGTASGFGGKRNDSETFYAFASFTRPTIIYRLDLTTGGTSVFKEPKVNFDNSAYETVQAFATSKDGTKVPMFITCRKGLKLDGNQPVLMNGYGGFNISLTPRFSIYNAVWLELGGVFVQTNLRGGGEYGQGWHLAGTKLMKQNTFDDFIACAEWLIANKYTSPRRLAISGGSNGGLLVGAALTQRPDLFAAVLPSVGVLDMLRFHQFTIGWAWTSDYGSADDPQEFKALHAYSPLHRLKTGVRYPATLITTADHDDRVVPAHSFKFAAQLQACQAKDGPPVLIRIETKAGHGGGTALNKIIEESTDELSFLVKTLGME
jgi:prolyl oligopeptidase